MSYYIYQDEADFFIAQENKDEALKKIKKDLVAKVDTLGHGGRWEGGKKLESWFTFTITEELLRARTLEEMLRGWGFDTENDADGNIVYIERLDGKAGQDELLLDTLAPFVRAESYINMHGEDGYMWRYYFNGEELLHQTGKIVYEYS